MPKVSTLAVYARRNKQNSPRTARQLISGTVVREIAIEQQGRNRVLCSCQDDGTAPGRAAAAAAAAASFTLRCIQLA